MLSLKVIPTTLALIIILLAAPQLASGDSFLRGCANISSSISFDAELAGYDVDIDLMGQGFGFSGEVYYESSPNLYLGVGMNFTVHSGGEFGVNGPGGSAAVPYTDLGSALTLSGGGFFTLSNDSKLTPFAGLMIGVGQLFWDYSAEIRDVYISDSDHIGIMFFAPRAGFTLPISEKIDFVFELRYFYTSYADETGNSYKWDMDGGNYMNTLVGFDLSL
jgi:hypothetical protein